MQLTEWIDRAHAAISSLDRRVVVAVGAAVLVAVSALSFALQRAAPAAEPAEVVLPRAAPAAAADRLLAVHAAGAVRQPGLYRLQAPARVADVLAAAGGPTPEADLDRLNLAAKVSDGERVYVPRRGEGGDGAPAGGDVASGAKVNLNTATLEQLDGLPGVGPATAKAILDHRARKGRFRSVRDLLDVRGIGEAKLAQLRDLVTV